MLQGEQTMIDSWIKSAMVGRVATVICLVATVALEKYGYKITPEDKKIVIEIIQYALLAWGAGAGLFSKAKQRASTQPTGLGQ